MYYCYRASFSYWRDNYEIESDLAYELWPGAIYFESSAYISDAKVCVEICAECENRFHKSDELMYCECGVQHALEIRIVNTKMRWRYVLL